MKKVPIIDITLKEYKLKNLQQKEKYPFLDCKGWKVTIISKNPFYIYGRQKQKHVEITIQETDNKYYIVITEEEEPYNIYYRKFIFSKQLAIETAVSIMKEISGE